MRFPCASSLRTILGVVLAAMGALGAAVGIDAVTVEHGRQLFVGERPMNGLIAGHASALPAHASRCMNCHSAAAEPKSVSASASTRLLGPMLTSDLLTRPVARRGGPPSRYDETALCTLLRTGVDPAHVITTRAMPRYELSVAECHALWVYLSK
jgi:hypothetical protein